MLVLAITLLLATPDDAATLLIRAQADLAAGRYAEVLEKGAESAELFHKIRDRAGEGRALTVIGLAHLYSGEYNRALANFDQALNIARETRNVEAEITRLNDIGNVFYFQGRYADSLDRYQQALRQVESQSAEKWSASRRQLTLANLAILYQTMGQFEVALGFYSEIQHSPQALPADEEAQLLTNIGVLRRRLGDPQKALQTYRAAQQLYRRAAHRDGEIAVLNNIGILQAMDLSDFPAANSTFGEALKLAEKSGDRPLAVHARLYRAETLYRAGRLEQSAGDFQAAADDAAFLGELEENWKALYGLARIANKRGEKAKADQLLGRSLELIEKLRVSLAGSSLRAGFLADKRDVYDLLIEHTNDPDKAFNLMERSRARILQDQLLRASMKSLKDVSQTLPVDTAILEYWLGSSSVAVLWISRTGSGLRRWGLSADDLEGIRLLISALSDTQRKDWRESARTMAQKLLYALPPLQQPAIRHLVIVPDDILAEVPFEALPLDESNLLIERYSVSYLPAASLFAVAAGRRGVRWPWQKTFEAFADPAPGNGNGVEIAALRGWSRLPGAVQEVNSIAKSVGGKRELHIGPDARKAILEDKAPSPLMHFATHAFADMQDPNRSYILFAPALSSQRYDYLFLKEVTALQFANVDLVTLSACETDAGKLVRGEGVTSFSHAFLATGARSVVTSLWDVSDKVTAGIMVDFYARLARGESKQDALRAAKLDLMRQSGATHPAYWAAFVLEGDGDSRIPYVIPWLWLIAPALLICIFVVFTLQKAKRELLFRYFHLH